MKEKDYEKKKKITREEKKTKRGYLALRPTKKNRKNKRSKKK